MVVLSGAAPGPQGIGRVLLVVNPRARRVADREREALAGFAAAGVACDVRHTEAAGHAGEIARGVLPGDDALGDGPNPSAPYDAVFTLGGDGTAMDVVAALAGSGVPVGVLPAGTGNLVARTLGVPLGTARAVAALLGGARTCVDLGALSTAGGGPPRLFAFAAGVGVDARMIERASPAWKRRVGVLAYVVTATQAVLARERFGVRLVVDGEETVTDATAVMVANFGAVLGDAFRFGPGIREDDGRLDVCIFRPRSFVESVSVFARLVRKDFRPHPALLYRAGQAIALDTDPPRPVQADGELLGRTPMTVRVLPLAATLLVPRARGTAPSAA